jgi:hypothetical protein
VFPDRSFAPRPPFVPLLAALVNLFSLFTLLVFLPVTLAAVFPVFLVGEQSPHREILMPRRER